MCPVLGCPVTDVNAALRARGGVKSTLGFLCSPRPILVTGSRRPEKFLLIQQLGRPACLLDPYI